MSSSHKIPLNFLTFCSQAFSSRREHYLESQIQNQTQFQIRGNLLSQSHKHQLHILNQLNGSSIPSISIHPHFLALLSPIHLPRSPKNPHDELPIYQPDRLYSTPFIVLMKSTRSQSSRSLGYNLSCKCLTSHKKSTYSEN